MSEELFAYGAWLTLLGGYLIWWGIDGWRKERYRRRILRHLRDVTEKNK